MINLNRKFILPALIAIASISAHADENVSVTMHNYTGKDTYFNVYSDNAAIGDDNAIHYYPKEPYTIDLYATNSNYAHWNLGIVKLGNNTYGNRLYYFIDKDSGAKYEVKDMKGAAGRQYINEKVNFNFEYDKDTKTYYIEIAPAH